MDDVWFDSGLTRRDVETILHALSLRADRPAALVAVADRGGRLVLASRALFRAFDVADAGALSARLLSGRDPGARRLAALGRTLAVNGAPRLERLRFTVAGRPEVVTFLCRRIALDGQAPLLVAAALGLGERAPGDARAAEPHAVDQLASGPDGASAALTNTLPETLPARASLTRPLVGQALARSLDQASRAEAGRGGPAEGAAGDVEAGEPVAPPKPSSHEPSSHEPPRHEPPRHEPFSLEPPSLEPAEAPAAGPSSRGPAEVAEALRARFGEASRRFLWQADASLRCTRVGPALAEAVGAGNADLVGRDMAAVARNLDPSGRLAGLLAEGATFGGVTLAWPVAAAAAAVTVELGGSPVPAGGFRGYGVIRPEAVVAHAPATLDGPLPAPEEAPEPAELDRPAAETAETAEITETAEPAEAEAPARALAAQQAEMFDQPSAAGNVVAFPGMLSARDRETFDALGSELRDRVGVDTPAAALSPPAAEAPAPGPAVVPAAIAASSDTLPLADRLAAETPQADPLSAHALRAAEAARNGLAVLDRLHVALLVSRSNVPIFANRHLLDLTGFADEDELHEAGGLKHLFGGVPGNGSGGEVVGVRARDGSVAFTTARMQQIEWDGLPATLLTLKEGPPAASSPGLPSAAPSLAAPSPVAQPRVADGGEVRALRAILETASDGVAVLDADCRVLSLNRSGEALTGRDRREVMGKPLLDLFAADDRAAAAAYLDELRRGAVQGAALGALNGGRELRLATGQGRAMPVQMTLGRLGQGEAGEDAAPRYCALFRPARAEATPARGGERSGAARFEALDGVAREVAPPLAVIAEAADRLAAERHGALGHASYREHVGAIRTAAGEIDALLRDLLVLSRAQAGRLALAAEPIDVNRIVGEAVSAAQPRASRERVIMRLSLAPNLPPVQADAATLRQIVGNLLGNAVSFNEPGGQVIVASAVGEDGGVAIRVRDTGPGLSEAEIAAALEPLVQGDARDAAATRTPSGGSSLALPLAKALAEANGATLAIRSKLEQGTMIEVLFPRERVVAGSGAA